MEIVLDRACALFPELDRSLLYVYGIDTGERYRDRFATSITYKGNRDTSRKPLFIEEMKEFVYRCYPCVQVTSHSMEADDYVSIFAHKYEAGATCVVGADKDLDQIRGKHYNFLKDRAYNLTVEQADRFFFEQLLTGDQADNIPGIFSIGPKRAVSYLSKANNPEDWWEIVLDKYTKAFPHMDEDQLTDMLYERGNLLWIQRHEGQTWYPPIPETEYISGQISLPI